jgi:hypothetical protein
MNTPTPAAPFAPAFLSLEQFVTHARKVMPVPTGHLHAAHYVYTSPDGESVVTQIRITHFAPNVYDQCTAAGGECLNSALANLITLLTAPTPCAASTPSA